MERSVVALVRREALESAKALHSRNAMVKSTDEMKEQALQVQLEKAGEAKRIADADSTTRTLVKRAEVREAEEWERARRTAEAEVQHLLNMEAENKKYLEKLEAEKKPAKGKGKK